MVSIRKLARQVRPVVALVTLLFVTPGALELVEDALHYAVHGDSLHDEGHEDDHCCSGAFHFCSCHARSVAAPAPMAHLVEQMPAWHERASTDGLARAEGGPLDPHLREILRPPMA